MIYALLFFRGLECETLCWKLNFAEVNEVDEEEQTAVNDTQRNPWAC